MSASSRIPFTFALRSESPLSARISSAQAQVTDYASLKATLLSRNKVRSAQAKGHCNFFYD